MFAREGNLSSPNFPLFYPPTTNCAWTIQVSFTQNVSNQVIKQLLSVKSQTENPINLSRCLGQPLLSFDLTVLTCMPLMFWR